MAYHFDKEAFFLQKLQNLDITQGIGDDGCVLMEYAHTSHIAKAKKSRAWCKKKDKTEKRESKIKPKAERDTFIIAMDSFCEGVHFLRKWLSPAQCVKKAFLVNASDMIAMGARPAYALLSVGLPKDWGRAEILAFVRGIDEAAKELEISLIGGDTISSKELQIHITMLGRAGRHLIYRDKIPPKSLLCYTHSPYPAQFPSKISKELSYLLKNSYKLPYHRDTSQNSPLNSPLNPPLNSFLQTKQQAKHKGQIAQHAKCLELVKSPSPSPFGRFCVPYLRGGFVLECARFFKGGMDISDGILSEIRRLCMLNHLGFTPSATFKPLSAMRLRALLQAGEVYEMLFAISPRDLGRIKKRAARHRICIGVLGTLTRTRGVKIPKAKCWH